MKKIQNLWKYYALTTCFMFVLSSFVYGQVGTKARQHQDYTLLYKMLDEPIYTNGDSNSVYCEQGPPSLVFEISIDTSNTDNWEPKALAFYDSATFTSASNKKTAHKTLMDGWLYFYRVKYGVNNDEVPNVIISNVVSSIQDMRPPTLDSIIVGVDSPNMVIYPNSTRTPEPAWLNNRNISVKFNISDISIKLDYDKNGNATGIPDTVRGAGIDEVCFYYGQLNNWWSNPDTCWDFYTDTTGAAGDSSVTETISKSLDDGTYALYFQSTDAAHSHDSRSGKMIVYGNATPKPTTETVAMATLGIDTQPPEVSINSDSLVNSTSLKVFYIADDPLKNNSESGLDSICLYYRVPAESDSFILYGCHSVNGDIEQVDSLFEFQANHGDGLYEFSVKAKDIAGNVTTSLNCSTFFDSQAPKLDSILVLDITLIEDSTNVAESGWSNELVVSVCPFGIDDPLNKQFKSGIDSIRIFEQDIFGNKDSTYNYNAGKECYQFILLPGDGEKEIRCTVKDSAGNWSDPVYEKIILDTMSPPLDSMTLADTSFDTSSTIFTDDISVYLYTFPNLQGADRFKILASENLSMSLDDSTTDYEDFSRPYLFKISDSSGNHQVYCSVRDSAGNWSDTLFNYIRYEPDIELTMVLKDTSSDEDKTRWTNNRTIGVKFNCVGVISHYALSETPSVIETLQPESPRWQPYPIDNDTLFEITTPNDDSEKWIYCRGMNKNSNAMSFPYRDFIGLDTNPPVVTKELSLSDTTEAWPGAAIPGWTNDLWVLTSVGLDDGLSGIDSIKSGFGGDVDSIRKIRYDSVYVHLTNENAQNEVSFQAFDQAGNVGDKVFATIIHDGEIPAIEKFIVSDPSTFGELDSIHCNDDSVEVTAILHDRLPGRLNLLELFQLDSFSQKQNVKYWDLSSNDANITVHYKYDINFLDPGDILTVFCSVYDAAGNPNDTFDRIKMALPPIIVMRMYDKYEPTDTLLSRSDTVGVKIIREQGLIDSICVSQYFDTLNCMFEPWPEGLDTIYTQYSFGLEETTAEVALWGIVKNNLGDEFSTSKSIVIDLQSPTIIKQNLLLWCPNSKDSLWANDREIEVRFKACDNIPGKLAKIIIAESEDLVDNAFEHKIESDQSGCISKQIPYTLSHQQGVKEIFVKVFDKAERSSETLKAGNINLNKTDRITNYPNPFSPRDDGKTNLFFILKKSSDLNVFIYDLFGNLVKKWKTKGQKGLNDISTDMNLTWNGRNDKGVRVATGGYILVIKADNETLKRKIAVIN